MQRKPRIAVLWDLQNTLCARRYLPIPEIQNYLEKSGILHDCVVGYDYDGKNCPILQKVEDAELFTPLPVTNRTKNNADRALIQYARKHFLRNAEINTVVLITSDGGFTPLVKELQKAGKKVWVIHKNKPNLKLIHTADRCIPWSEIIGGNTSSPVPSKPPFGKQAQRKPQKQQPLALAITMTSV